MALEGAAAAGERNAGDGVAQDCGGGGGWGVDGPAVEQHVSQRPHGVPVGSHPKAAAPRLHVTT